MPTPLHPTIDLWRSAGRELGMITFLESRPLAERAMDVPPPRFTGIGLCEADVLCLREESGELVVLDHEVPGRVLCEVAADQESFLRAADVLQEHFAKCATQDAYRRDKQAAESVARVSAAAAGGDRYESFYHMMVGA
jgi:hypothetical protein